MDGFIESRGLQYRGTPRGGLKMGLFLLKEKAGVWDEEEVINNSSIKTFFLC